MRSAIETLWKTIRHGDRQHQEWLRDQLMDWAWDEFNVSMKPYKDLLLTDDVPTDEERNETIQNNT